MCSGATVLLAGSCSLKVEVQTGQIILRHEVLLMTLQCSFRMLQILQLQEVQILLPFEQVTGVMGVFCCLLHKSVLWTQLKAMQSLLGRQGSSMPRCLEGGVNIYSLLGVFLIHFDVYITIHLYSYT